MQSTENYGLNKPEVNDFYNVEDFNENMDIIDNELKKAESKASVSDLTSISKGISLSSAGWWRIARCSAGGNGDSGLIGGADNSCKIVLKRSYSNTNNEHHEVELLGVYNNLKFRDIANLTNVQLLTQIRYVTDTDGFGYIEVYYNASVGNGLMVILNDVKATSGSWELIDPVSTTSTCTVRASMLLNANTTEYLPLTGGTMSGTINTTQGVNVNASDSYIARGFSFKNSSNEMQGMIGAYAEYGTWKRVFMSMGGSSSAFKTGLEITADTIQWKGKDLVTGTVLFEGIAQDVEIADDGSNYRFLVDFFITDSDGNSISKTILTDGVYDDSSNIPIDNTTINVLSYCMRWIDGVFMIRAYEDKYESGKRSSSVDASCGITKIIGLKN